jgi:hypothetical protein
MWKQHERAAEEVLGQKARIQDNIWIGNLQAMLLRPI